MYGLRIACLAKSSSSSLALCLSFSACSTACSLLASVAGTSAEASLEGTFGLSLDFGFSRVPAMA